MTCMWRFPVTAAAGSIPPTPWGGAELLDETIELFGIHIDGNIAIDFEGFAECVDIIGGVDIEATASEAACINKEIYKKHPSIISGTDLMDRWALQKRTHRQTGSSVCPNS